MDEKFQLGHFFSEMDRGIEELLRTKASAVSIGPLLFRNG